MSDSNDRIYGMADEENRQTPAPEGFRGERAPTVDNRELRHKALTGTGPVEVQETSGVAFVEASGAPGPAKTEEQANDDYDLQV